MNLLTLTGVVLILAAIVVNIMSIVMGFKVSLRNGVVALLAALLLGAALTVSSIVAHQAAMAEVGAAEVRQQGEEEAKEQIDDLKKMDNVDLGL
ncbi:MAG: hypothetical protein JXR76_20370 [Deltaproteobacteria bacterium]|nr:hypothetical protein [Deltaproteobacteria bacterium]